jgi:epsilon-lactone hydrolase
MPSWQSYLVHPFLRMFVKRRLAVVTSPLEARAILGNPLPPVPGANYTAGSMGGIAGEWARGEMRRAQLLYLHGGAYFTCSPQTHRSITGAFAIRGFSTFAPDYRLAPEHPFPAAIEDALNAYRGMLERWPAEKLVVAGDSAGGGLALATMLAAKDKGMPMPGCIILFSPWTDLACTGASLETNADRDSMLYAPRMREGAAIYLAGADPMDPLASPLYGNLAGLPPILIQVGDMEVLLDDSTRLAERAQEAGVRVELSLWPNLPHVWQVSQMLLPEARKALDEAAAFADSALALQAAPA